MNGPFLLLRATVGFARTGFAFYVRLVGPKWANRVFWGGMGASAVVAIFLQLKGV